MRLASLDLLHADGIDPVLILDDVFAELDEVRRERVVAAMESVEQTFITAAVLRDLPDNLGSRVGSSSLVEVSDGVPHKAEEGGALDTRQPTTTGPGTHQETHTAHQFPHGTLALVYQVEPGEVLPGVPLREWGGPVVPSESNPTGSDASEGTRTNTTPDVSVECDEDDTAGVE